MSRNSLLSGLMIAILGFTAYADDKHEHPVPAAPKNAGLDKMKTLVGTWVVADKDGKPTEEVASIIKVTASGSAVRIMATTPAREGRGRREGRRRFESFGVEAPRSKPWRARGSPS